MAEQHQEQEREQEQHQPGLSSTLAPSTTQGGSVASTSASSSAVTAGLGPASAASGVKKEKKVAGGPPKSKAYANPLASRGDEIKYRTKFKQLKGKVQEIEEENQKTQAKILKANRQVQRLRLERSILYERFAAAKQSGELGYSSTVAESSIAPNLNQMRLPLEPSAGMILEYPNGDSTAGPPQFSPLPQQTSALPSGAFDPHQQLLPRPPGVHSPTSSSVAGYASQSDQHSPFLSHERLPRPPQPFAQAAFEEERSTSVLKALPSGVENIDSGMQEDTAP